MNKTYSIPCPHTACPYSSRENAGNNTTGIRTHLRQHRKSNLWWRHKQISEFSITCQEPQCGRLFVSKIDTLRPALTSHLTTGHDYPEQSASSQSLQSFFQTINLVSHTINEPDSSNCPPKVRLPFQDADRLALGTQIKKYTEDIYHYESIRKQYNLTSIDNLVSFLMKYTACFFKGWNSQSINMEILHEVDFPLYTDGYLAGYIAHMEKLLKQDQE